MKKTKLVLLAGIVTSLALVASGCGKKCKEAREEILQPSQTVVTYLQANPDGQTLASSGCALVLDQLKNLPQGAQVIRSIADTRFTDTYRRCLFWETGVRYNCYYGPGHHGYPGHQQCFPEQYTYCGQWEYYNVHNEPGYTEAMTLAQDLDSLYAKAHDTCGLAFAGKYDEAYESSKDLLDYMSATANPEEQKVYALACGGR